MKYFWAFMEMGWLDGFKRDKIAMFGYSGALSVNRILKNIEIIMIT